MSARVRFVRACALVLAVVSTRIPDALAQSGVELLPRRPEVTARESKDGTLRISVRGRDCSARDFLSAIGERSGIEVLADAVAEKPLKDTLLTVELYERRPESIIELIAASAGVDLATEAEGRRFKLLGDDGSGVRPMLKSSIEQFYKMALARQGDDETNARSLRGLADVLRSAGDFAGAYAAYEQLLETHANSEFAADSELLLADCYMQLDQNARANELLRSFLSKCSDNARAELALRRLVTLLLEQRRYHEIVTLHEALERLGILRPETLSVLADAAAVMLEESDADASTFLLGLFREHPTEHAMLGPVLGLALSKKGAHEAAEKVLRRAGESLGKEIDSTAALLAYGELSRRAGSLRAALLFGHRAVLAAADNPILKRRAHLLLADLYESLGVTQRAYHHLWEAEQLSSPMDAPKLALRSAELALAENEPEHARLLFQSAAQYENSQLDGDLGVVRSLLAAKDTKRALSRLSEIAGLPLGGADRRRIELLAVDCFVAAGRIDDALAALEGKLDALKEQTP